MKIVSIDASAAATWILPTQSTVRADTFFDQADYDRLIAPDVFAWEVGALIARRVTGSSADRARALSILELLEIEIDQPRAWPEVAATIEVAAARTLSLFDNAYLDQCLETGAALASRDRRLIGAARAAGVEVFDLRDETP